MRIISVNLREEQIKILDDLKILNKIASRSEFFRRLLDQEISKMVTLYERFSLIIKMRD